MTLPEAPAKRIDAEGRCCSTCKHWTRINGDGGSCWVPMPSWSRMDGGCATWASEGSNCAAWNKGETKP